MAEGVEEAVAGGKAPLCGSFHGSVCPGHGLPLLSRLLLDATDSATEPCVLIHSRTIFSIFLSHIEVSILKARATLSSCWNQAFCN